MRTLSLLAMLATAGIVSVHAQESMPPAAPQDLAPGVEQNTSSIEEKRAAREAKQSTLAEAAMADERFTQLVKAIQVAGLEKTLAEPGPYTLFAPTNEAFAAQPDAETWLTGENKARLKAVLTHHVVAGTIRLEDIPEGVTEVPTLDGTKLKLERKGAVITVNGATLADKDIMASNGVIHAIDQVVLPDTATN